MPVFLLPDLIQKFPDASFAEPTGLLAVGGQLNTDSILEAYQNGSFPWYHVDEAPHWYCLTPRLMLVPQEVNISKSMRSLIKASKYTLSCDTHFIEVMNACRNIERKNQDGSWIHYEIMDAFNQLHKEGIAHSVEVWRDQQMVGGLYGLAIGDMFCGESMFAIEPNTSKLALIGLCKLLQKKEFKYVDCQQDTPHLKSMGAKLISKADFFSFLQENKTKEIIREKWIEAVLL